MFEDKKLVDDFLAGDDSAFSKLVKKYLKPVYNFIFQLTNDKSVLDDLVQTTFIKAWKNLRKFDRSRNFKAWIFSIAKNTTIDYFKKKKAIPFSFFENEEGYNRLEEVPEDYSLPDELMEKEEIAENIEKIIRKIPDRYRIILLMRYKDDFSLKEIAEILDIPYNTAKSQHGRALEQLKKEISNMDASKIIH